jgi:hypothetical protein
MVKPRRHRRPSIVNRIMKPKTCCFLVLACLSLLGRVSAAEVFRTDINPALLYWQAFAVIPDLPTEDQKYLFDSEWRNRPMDERAGQLAMRFDATFRFLRQAAASQVACDWGIDMSEGPYTLLPHLAKAKRCAQAATLRARWFVQQNRQDAARDDLVAAFVMGRNLARDQVLISGLVQIAIESIISGYVVQQWPQLDTETIGALLTAFDNASPRGTMAASMRTEKTAFYDWMVRQIEAIQSKYPADDQSAPATAAQLLNGIVSGEGQIRKGYGAEVIKAAGNSIAGLMKYVRELEPFYAEVEQTMKLPYEEYQPAIEAVQQRIAANPNLLLQEFFPAVMKVRLKEFRITARLAMVRAAYEHRLDPSAGLGKIQDPFGTGPFEYSRFMLEGIDRGFKLKSQLKVPDFDEVLIFAEKAGPAFSIDGPNAGQKVP